jgi:hypothetical protein
MIRPFTCVCVLLAAGSGLYLYQTKHRTLMLDRQIADVLRQADEARARTAVLKAEYAMLSDPARLTELSGRFLALKPSMPTQYVQLADLDAHLPPVETFPKPGDAPAPAPAGSSGGTDLDDDTLDDALTQPVVAAVQPAPAPHAVAVASAAARPAGQQASAPMHDATRVAQAGAPAAAARPVHKAPPAATQVAAAGAANGLHAATTVAVHPRAAEAGYAAYVAPVYRPPYRPTSVSSVGVGGSMLGQSSTLTLAAPVPVAN